MEPEIFVLVYISTGYLILYATWLLTALKENKARLLFGLRLTVIIQSVLNLLHLISGIFFPLMATPDIPIRSFGLTLFTVGVWIAVWARITMGKRWSIPGRFDSTNNSDFVKAGPFSYTRNPIYVGIILISFGMAIALKSVFLIFSFFLYVHLYMKIREEEKSLQSHFHDEYTKYRLEVPRFI